MAGVGSGLASVHSQPWRHQVWALLCLALVGGYLASWGIYFFAWIGYCGYDVFSVVPPITPTIVWATPYDDYFLWFGITFPAAAVFGSLFLATRGHLRPSSWLTRVLNASSDLSSRVLFSSKWLNGPFTLGFVVIGLVVLLAFFWVGGLWVQFWLIGNLTNSPAEMWGVAFSDSTIAYANVYAVGAGVGQPLLLLFGLAYVSVTRTSSILRFTGISYEKAVVYHRLLGYWMVGVTWLHGILCYVGWLGAPDWWGNFTGWRADGLSNLAGEGRGRVEG